jgi:hypothetical protein
MQSATITEEITSLARRRNRDWVLGLATRGLRCADRDRLRRRLHLGTELSRTGQATGARACFSSPWPAPRPTPVLPLALAALPAAVGHHGRVLATAPARIDPVVMP